MQIKVPRNKTSTGRCCCTIATRHQKTALLHAMSEGDNVPFATAARVDSIKSSISASLHGAAVWAASTAAEVDGVMAWL